MYALYHAANKRKVVVLARHTSAHGTQDKKDEAYAYIADILFKLLWTLT